MAARLDLLPGAPIVYIDAGARGERKNRILKHFPNAVYVGFEPDVDECARLNQTTTDGFTYFPIALGRQEGTRSLHVTGSPACSSFLTPNAVLLERFLDLAPEFMVVRTVEMETASLDTFLPAHGIDQADFLKLDTQGTELEILEGADRLLRASILGVRVEVEFAPMYLGQPLFADVDRFLRERDFCLFDLNRYRVRRKRFPRASPTRGQLLWGQALYLKRAETLDSAASRLRLAALATIFGFGDYGLEILDSVVKQEREDLPASHLEWAKKTRAQLRATPAPRRLARLALRTEHSPLGSWWRRFVSACRAVVRVADDNERTRSNVWRD